MKSSGDDRQAGLAQLEERGSHNPEVVSSSLTTRIIFDFLISVFVDSFLFAAAILGYNTQAEVLCIIRRIIIDWPDYLS